MRCGAELRRTGLLTPEPPRQLTVPATPLMASPRATLDDAGAPALGQAVGAPGHAPAPVRLAPGAIVDGKYRVERVLGEGGMGVVYLAQDLNTDAKVVVKALHADLAGNEEFRARVRAEARALAHIDHPNVVRLNAVVAAEGSLLLIMQYVEGESLDKFVERRVRARQAISLEEALTLFRQIVMGVGAAHAEGVVHRDIKPANVLLRSKDHVAKVTDFGIAKSEEDAKAGRGMTRGIIGSLWYMSPEQVTGQRDLDKRVDVYALGIVLFELLMGRVPFDGDSEYEIMKRHVEGELPSVSAARPDIPPEVDGMIRRACAKSRDDRYASCEELLVDVERLLVKVAPHVLGTAVHALHVQPPPTPVDAIGPSAAAPPPVVAPLPPAPPPPPITPAPTAPPIVGEAPPRRGLGIAVGVLGLVALVAIGAIGVRWFGGGAPGDAPATGGSAAPTASPSTSHPPAPEEGLAALAGRWVSDSERHYEAVFTRGGDLEFRVRFPTEFEGQNYIEGEPRFTLREGKSAGIYAVEDKIRPVPPVGFTYEPSSRGTCQEDWTEIGGQPLVARWDGSRLRVDLAKVTPDAGMFQRSGAKIVGCNKIGKSSASKIESSLHRE